MSYIIKSTNPFINVKLTEKGREKLATGTLNFSYYALGDSEINYNREFIVDNNPNDVTLSGSSIILKPKDKQPDIKYFISTGDTVLNTMDDSNLRVIKASINNEAVERGFFSADTSNEYLSLTGDTHIKGYGIIDNSSISGGTTIDLTTGLTVNDIVCLKLSNDNTGSLSALTNSTPIPNIFYKIEELDDTIATLDRDLPDIATSTATTEFFVYPGGEVADGFGYGNTSAYWDTGTLSFVNNSIVSIEENPVWCFNNVWEESILGLTGTTYEDYTKFGSYPYLGDKNNYLGYELSGNTGSIDNTDICGNGDGFGYFDDANRSLGIIHYTNNTISNFYGEYIYIDSNTSKNLEIYLPTLLYHRRTASTASGTTSGMKFIASGDTYYVNDSEVEYINLVEDPSMVTGKRPKIIGRVYPQLKIITIHDIEILSALSYKSNRNWTLPGLNIRSKSPSIGGANGVLESGKTIYMTYAIENNTSSGITTSLPCQKYSKLTNTTSSSKDIEFTLEDIDLLPYMRKIEEVDYDGLGFYGYDFKVLYQIVDSATTRPDKDNWSEVDYTSTGITGTISETIDPKLLENQNPSTNGFILDYTTHQTYSGDTYSLNDKLNLPLNSNPENLNFGDERFFYGNLKTYIGATIYKTIFSVAIPSDSYTVTSNPTRGNDGSEPDIRVSELGIYDSNQELVVIGKLSQPIKLTNGSTIMIEMSMDF